MFVLLVGVCVLVRGAGYDLFCCVCVCLCFVLVYIFVVVVCWFELLRCVGIALLRFG